ncbi:MAG: cell division protein FtsA [Elusimicrobiota bacterium]|jgi:cell division protein FtsA|nr:cell division protein FtsA [Elusimicrobiota bacterium]
MKHIEKKPTKVVSTTTQPLAAGIDIGSNQVTCVVGIIDEELQKINVLGNSIVKCANKRCIEAGEIKNIAEAGHAIRAAVKEAERTAGGEASYYAVAVRGRFIEARKAIGKSSTDPAKREVTNDTIDDAINNARDVITGDLSYASDILQIIPNDYTLDGASGIQEALGMGGINLEIEVHALAAPILKIENIDKALQHAEVNSQVKVYSYLAASEILVRPDEKELGCLVVDFGGSTIGLVLYIDNIKFICEIQAGSDLITKYISRNFKAPLDEARRIKEEFGAAVIGDDFQNYDFEYLAADGVSLKKNERIYLIQEVIQPEIDRMLTKIESVLRDKGYTKDDLSGGIILTGGGSLMESMKDAFERFFDGCSVRIARPVTEKVIGLNNIIANPSYTAATGALYYLFSSSPEQIESRETYTFSSLSFLNKVKKFFKEIF